MSTSKVPNKIAPTRSLLDLSWEDLFSQPVSLRGLELEEDFDVDQEDYSFLLDLDLEALFKIPYSVQQYQENLEESSAGDQDPREYNIPTRSGSQQVLNVNHVNAPNGVKSKAIDTKSKNSNEETEETTELPPTFEEPPVNTVVEPVGILTLNETDVFISEGAEVTANLFTLAGLGAEPGVVIEIFGVTDNGVGDLNPAMGNISVDTAYGTIAVDVNSGEFSYEYDDASSVPDEQQTVTEQVDYKVELFADSSVVDYFLNVVIDLNQAPIAVDDTYQVNADTVLTVNSVNQGLLGNDTDPDNSETITDLKMLTKINGDGNIFSGYISLPGGGAVNVNQNGTFSFDPGEDFLHLDPGEIEVVNFNYTMIDAEGLESIGQVAIDVVGVVPPEINFPIDEMPMASPHESHVLTPSDMIWSSDLSDIHHTMAHLPDLPLASDTLYPEII